MDDLDSSIQARIEQNPHYAEMLDETVRRLADRGVPDPQRKSHEWAEWAESEGNPDPIVTRRVRGQRAKAAPRK